MNFYGPFHGLVTRAPRSGTTTLRTTGVNSRL